MVSSFVALSTTFERPYAKAPVHRDPATPSRHVLTGSLYSEFQRNNLVLFGEIAHNATGGIGWNIGGLLALDKHFEAILAARNYSSTYFSFRAQTMMSHSSVPQNEIGIYWGLKFTSGKHLVLGAYADIYQHPGNPRNGLFAKSGVEGMLSMELNPNPRVRIRGLLRIKNLHSPLVIDTVSLTTTQKQSRYQLKIDSEIVANDFLNLHFGVGHSSFELADETTTGFLIYQDITYRLPFIRLSSRIALVDSNFENRFYLHEKDIYRSVLIPAYHGKAMKYYFVISSKVGKNINLSAKWSHTHYHDRDVIGSGLDQIAGNTKTLWKAQVYYKF